MRSRLLPVDVLRVASVGLRTRRLRAALSALGVAIGIASMVAVLGISDSSKAGLVARAERTRHEPADGRARADLLRRRTRSCPNRRTAAVRNLASVRRLPP